MRPAPVAALMAQSATLMTAFRSISKSVLAEILRGGLSIWYDANRSDTVAVGKVKATAHKCDLCAGRENGPACVENCPADALQLVTDAALSGMAKSAACAPHVRNNNRGMPVPRRKKCR